MPELNFRVIGVEPVAHGLAPLFHFKIEVTNSRALEVIESVLLHAQIQIQPAQRGYTPKERENLADLFGTPEQWGASLRNRLWAHAQAIVRRFAGSTEVTLPVQCTYDLNVLGSKYFDALDDGEVSLLFLFSGSIFHTTAEGLLQVQQISWEKEFVYRMTVKVWREMMEQHYPNSAWLSLRKDIFNELSAYKRRHGLTAWEQVMERLLANERAAKQGRSRDFSDEQALQGLI